MMLQSSFESRRRLLSLKRKLNFVPWVLSMAIIFNSVDTHLNQKCLKIDICVQCERHSLYGQ